MLERIGVRAASSLQCLSKSRQPRADDQHRPTLPLLNLLRQALDCGACVFSVDGAVASMPEAVEDLTNPRTLCREERRGGLPCVHQPFRSAGEELVIGQSVDPPKVQVDRSGVQNLQELLGRQLGMVAGLVAPTVELLNLGHRCLGEALQFRQGSGLAGGRESAFQVAPRFFVPTLQELRDSECDTAPNCHDGTRLVRGL